MTPHKHAIGTLQEKADELRKQAGYIAKEAERYEAMAAAQREKESRYLRSAEQTEAAIASLRAAEKRIRLYGVDPITQGGEA